MSTLDWFVIAAYLASMLAVGEFFARRNRSIDDYLLGGRRMNPIAVGVSLFATLVSTLSYLAWPGEMIRHGPGFMAELAVYPLVMFLVGWIVIPAIMRQKATTAYELLETRLGASVRLLGAALFLTMRIVWMAVIIYVTSNTVLVPLLGLDPAWLPSVCAAMGLVTVVYASAGGLQAVVMTDVIQACLMFGGAILTVAVVTTDVGVVNSWPSHWPTHWTSTQLLPSAESSRSLVGFMLMALVWSTCTGSSDQMAIQRYLATRNAVHARRAYIVSLIAGAAITICLALVGVTLYAYYQQRPDRLPAGIDLLAGADRLFPLFIAEVLPTGASGLVVAALLSAAMSSLSSGLNASCSVIVVDFLDRQRARRLTDVAHVSLARYTSYILGLAVVLLSVLVGQVQGNIFELCQKLVNLLTAPLAGLFLLALFVPRATPLGAYVGTACGIAVVVAVNYWDQWTGQRGVSFLWAMPLSLAAQFGIGALVSVVWPGRESTIGYPSQV